MAKAGNKKRRKMLFYHRRSDHVSGKGAGSADACDHPGITFDNAYVIMECLCPKFVNKREGGKIYPVHRCGLYLGAQTALKELGDVAKGLCKVKNDNILRGMWVLNPEFKLVTWIPVVKNVAENLVFEKA